MANYRTYADICNDVTRATGDMSDVRIDEVKSVINMVYLNEIMTCDELYPCLWFLACLDDSILTRVPAAVTGITAASPPVVTAAAHGLATGDIVQLDGIAGMTELNHRICHFTKITADTGSLQTLDGANIDATACTAYAGGGTLYHRGVTLGAGIESILTAAWHGYGGQMTPIGAAELERDTRYWDPGNSGRPERYLERKCLTAAGAEANRLLWFPLPDAAYRLRAWQEKQPARLSADADVPILPYRFHDAIVAGSIMRLVKYEGIQVESAVSWPGIYRGHLEALRTINRGWWRKFEENLGGGGWLS